MIRSLHFSIFKLALFSFYTFSSETYPRHKRMKEKEWKYYVWLTTAWWNTVRTFKPGAHSGICQGGGLTSFLSMGTQHQFHWSREWGWATIIPWSLNYLIILTPCTLVTKLPYFLDTLYLDHSITILSWHLYIDHSISILSWHPVPWSLNFHIILIPFNLIT